MNDEFSILWDELQTLVKTEKIMKGPRKIRDMGRKQQYKSASGKMQLMQLETNNLKPRDVMGLRDLGSQKG